MSAKSLTESFESGKAVNNQEKHVLIVYAHQEPKSFNGALLRTAVEALEAKGHSVEVSDLYSMHFEPRCQKSDINGTLQDTDDFFKYQAQTREAYANGSLSQDIVTETEKLKRADLVIFQFPLYWFSVPAIMKGWFDRVYVMGLAFGFGKMYHNAPMKGKKAMLSFTTGGPEESFSNSGMHGDMNVLLWPLQNGVLNFVGFEVLPPQIFFAAERVDDEQRKTWLSDWSKRLNNIFDEKPINFVHVSNFEPYNLKDDYVEEQKARQYGPSVGYNLGKPYPPDCMRKS